jgi:hypothetical protein
MFRVLGSRRLTDEVLRTTMCLVEQTLNARPLVPSSADVSDLEALTLNHFLIGRPGSALPVFLTSPGDVDHRKGFRQAEAYADLVWARWLREYAPTLQPRPKWRHEVPSLASGDLVWLLDPSCRRGEFLLGRVLETFPGDDGCVRAARVRTRTGDYTRPVVRLAPVRLPESVPVATVHGAGNVKDVIP